MHCGQGVSQIRRGELGFEPSEPPGQGEAKTNPAPKTGATGMETVLSVTCCTVCFGAGTESFAF